ncbi:MAG: hypothetical protein IJO63_01540 [Bacilli bacterium]|nr:hypothetical protein [Bacilli bacterium]
MQFCQFNISNYEGKSNCVVRSFCKLLNKEYDDVFKELCDIQFSLQKDSYNDIDVFETYMLNHKIMPISYGYDMLVKDLNLDNGSHIVFCYDKKDYYHMIPIINNTIYDKNESCKDLFVIKIYKK